MAERRDSTGSPGGEPAWALSLLLLLAAAGVNGCDRDVELFPEVDSTANAGTGGGSMVGVSGTSGASGTPSDGDHFEVLSAGALAEGGQAEAPEEYAGLGAAVILKNGELLYWGSGGGVNTERGLNVAVIDPTTRELSGAVVSFDTYVTRDTDQQNSDLARQYLENIDAGMIVVVSVADEAGLNYSSFEVGPDGGMRSTCEIRTDEHTMALFRELEDLGSARIDEYCYRASWVLVAVKGEGRVLGEALEYDAPATVAFRLPLE